MTNQFNRASVTDADIQRLRDEAAAHGDRDQVRLCELALAGDAEAWGRCVDAIESAAAMAD